MMKAIPGLVVIGLLTCSCTIFERAGLAVPKAQSSESLEVLEAGFVLLHRSKEVVLSVTVEVLGEVDEGRVLRVTFPTGESKVPTEVVTLDLTGEKEWRARSSSLAGLQYLDSYPVLVELVSGGEVLEKFTQYVRFEVPPSALEKMGVTL